MKTECNQDARNAQDLGKEVEILQKGVCVDRARVVAENPKQITIVTITKGEVVTLLFDQDDSGWKLTFRDMEGRLCISKDSPGYTIRPVPVTV